MNEALYQKIRCHESLCQTKLSISFFDIFFFNIISIIYSTYMKMGNMTCLEISDESFFKGSFNRKKGLFNVAIYLYKFPFS